MALPRPTGPCGVGAITAELVDARRPVHLASQTPGRRLLIKAWYAAAHAPTSTEPLWIELRRDPQTPLAMRLLLRCLRVRTATMPAASISPHVRKAPLVLYNHGLVSFAAENTSLMEELASYGCIVIAIQHTEQLAEFRALGGRRTDTERRRRKALERRLSTALPHEKAALAPEYYDAADTTRRIVLERSADTSFVIANLGAVLGRIPGLAPDSADTSGVHLAGFSLGGAVATVTAERDARVCSVANLDGGMYGCRRARDLRLPYLMMYSEVNDGINDALLPAHAQCLVPAGTLHLNYHDIAGVLPVLRYVRAVGTTDGEAFLTRRNGAVREFVLAASGA